MNRENITRSIIKEIVSECAIANIPVHEDFVAYYTKLLTLDPRWKISGYVASNRADIENFVQFVLNQLKNQKTPSMIALKMQLHFKCNFDKRKIFIEKNRRDLLLKISPIKNEIFRVESVKGAAEVAKLYEKMVFYITLASGLGNPNLINVFKEAKAALASVLFPNELKQFASNLTTKEKEDELNDLVKLVSGIRIYNKDIKKGGFGMEDVQTMTKDACMSLRCQLVDALMDIIEKVNILTTGMDLSYKECEDCKEWLQLCLPDSVTETDFEYFKDLLLVYRQFELYVRILLDEVEEIKNENQSLYNELRATLRLLNEVVGFRIAIPCEEVFPIFRDLHKIWCQAQDQAILVAKMSQILTNMNFYLTQLDFDEALVKKLIGEEYVQSDMERLLSPSEAATFEGWESKDKQVKIKPRAQFNDLDKVYFQYLGFCGAKLVETQGALLPGIPDLGICKTRNMNFVCSSNKALKMFAHNSERYILLLCELARKKPELINFLEIYDTLEALASIKKLREVEEEGISYHDIGIQTETHILTRHKDRNYKWNVWDLKREAMKFADLSKMSTVSTQTKSGSIFNIGIQTNDMVNQGYKTKEDNYTSTPNPKVFLYGLRGRTDDKQCTVDLTRSVEE